MLSSRTFPSEPRAQLQPGPLLDPAVGIPQSGQVSVTEKLPMLTSPHVILYGRVSESVILVYLNPG